MAENESLDLGKAPRWRTVFTAVNRHETSEEVGEKARKSLYRTLRAVKKLIPFDQLLSASCNDPDRLPDLIRSCSKGRDFARLFQDVAQKGAGRETVLQDYLWALCDRFFDQIATRTISTDQWASVSDLHRHLAEVKECLCDDINLIAQKLAECPDWQIRMRPSRNGSVSQTATSALLNESLLVPPK